MNATFTSHAADSSAESSLICAVDIGGSKFEAGLVTLKGELVDARVEVDPDVGPQSHFAALAGIVTEQMDRASGHHGKIVPAIGIGCAGPIERNCESVSPVNIASWNEFPLRQFLADLLDCRSTAILMPRRLRWRKLARCSARGTGVLRDDGVNRNCGGIFVDGDLLDGDGGNAGHVGHLIVEPGGRRCGCGARVSRGRSLRARNRGDHQWRPSEPTYDIMQRTGRYVGRGQR